MTPPGDPRNGASPRGGPTRGQVRPRDPGAAAAPWYRRRGQAAADTRPGTLSHLDAAAGSLVRPYAMTGGRTRPAGSGLDMISIVVATRERFDWHLLEPEHAAILRLCHRPVSVAELSAQMDIPMTVVKVLLGDLIARGDVLARAPLPPADLPEMNILQAVLDGIRRL
ncbi:DUF742 domain-containing protein [Nocardiopsis sediminis]|uniref:DUF742 domain-containing protein n=1 Tax=Nocardiopsis sediminis TaxID=1778267 RepID=A0ABV8FU48_9ACTN